MLIQGFLFEDDREKKNIYSDSYLVNRKPEKTSFGTENPDHYSAINEGINKKEIYLYFEQINP